MSPVVDGIMILLFILFMIFIFGGYHKNKSAKREEQFRIDELKLQESDKENS